MMPSSTPASTSATSSHRSHSKSDSAHSGSPKPHAPKPREAKAHAEKVSQADKVSHAHKPAHASHAVEATVSAGHDEGTTPKSTKVVSGVVFADLGLNRDILDAVTHEGYTHPTPIQAQAIPHILEGKDVLGCAQTGTGKTAAFALPMIHRLMARLNAVTHANGASQQHQSQQPGSRGGRVAHRTESFRPIRALILSPTRELALQIDESFRTYGRHSRLRFTTIFGGVGQGNQVRALREGVDIVVATPGRLMDLMQQGYVDLRSVEIFVLDEADRMLDMGFIDPIRTIAAKVPSERQTLLFSATMPKEIRHLADAMLRDPVSVQVAPVASTSDLIKQSMYLVRRENKPALLGHVLSTVSVTRALVFTRTKHGADRVVRGLLRQGFNAEAIHGNKSQNNRQRTLLNFRSGKTMVLVATDIAARGIDVDGVSHVFNFDLPNEPENYVHRIGRTGRAGVRGEAISFCDMNSDERGYLRDIERLIKKPVPVRDDLPKFDPALHAPVPDHGEEERDERPSRGGYGQRGNRRDEGGNAGFSDRPQRFSRPSFGDRASAPAFGASRGPAFTPRNEGTRNAPSNGHGEVHTRPVSPARPARPSSAPRSAYPAAPSDRPQNAGHAGGHGHTKPGPTSRGNHSTKPGPKRFSGRRSEH